MEDWYNLSHPYFEQFYDLNIVQHISANKHAIGYLKANHQKVFIKTYSNIDNFDMELKVILVYCPHQCLSYFKDDHQAFLVLKYQDYRAFSFKTKKDIHQAALLLAQFHHILASNKNFNHNIQVTPISVRIKHRMKQLQHHPKYDQFNLIYLHFLQRIDQLDEAFLNHEAIQFIHGDFGVRNMVICHNTLQLIDFERVRVDHLWMDLIKLFEFELVSKKHQAIFLDAYLKQRPIEKIPHHLYDAFVFLEMLGIYKYCQNVQDEAFLIKADQLLNRLEKRLSKAIN